MFKLELAKETAEKEGTRLEREKEEQQREVEAMRKEIGEYKESSRSLKEIVVKREKSLQEKVQVRLFK